MHSPPLVPLSAKAKRGKIFWLITDIQYYTIIYSLFFASAEKRVGGMSTCDLREELLPVEFC
jgi:hypothetical protein